MSIVPIEHVPSGGVHWTGSANLDQPFGSYRKLVNCRLSPSGGKVEQTPAWYSSKTWTQGTYWDSLAAAGATEPATSAPSLLYITLGDPTIGYNYVAAAELSFRVNGVQFQVIKQTTAPTPTNPLIPLPINGCLATFGSYISLFLGGRLDVVIDGTATFKWRVNGGAYTTLVPIAASVTLGATDITLYFLPTAGAYTGYTLNDTWSWQRTDAPSHSNSTGYINPINWPYTIYRHDVSGLYQFYFIAGDGQVMFFDGLGVRSVGYRPIYALCLEIYEDHLVVGSYATVYGNAASSTVIAWSDLRDFDNFIATDTNEADTYTVPALRPTSNATSTLTGVYGLYTLNGVLFADLYNQRVATQYLGLPAVFSFKRFAPLEYINGSPFVIKTKTRIYYPQVDGIYSFDGANAVKLSQKLDGLFTTNTNPVSPVSFYQNLYGGLVNSVTQEVWFYSFADLDRAQQAFFIYSEVTGEWYTRAGSFLNSPSFSATRGMGLAFPAGIAVLSKALGLLAEDVLGTQTTLVKDGSQGTVFQTPTIELQDISQPSVQAVKDIQSLYLDAYYPTQPSSAYTCTGVQIEVARRMYADAAVTYTSSPTPPVWTTAKPDGIISQRIPGSRIFRFRITPLTGNSAKYPFGFAFNRFIINVVGIDAKEVRK